MFLRLDCENIHVNWEWDQSGLRNTVLTVNSCPCEPSGFSRSTAVSAPHRPLESDLSRWRRWTDLRASRLITALLFKSGSWSNQSRSDAAPRSISLFLPFSHYHSVSTRSSSSPFSCWLSWGVFPHLFMWHPLIINETEVSKEALEWWWCGAKDRPGREAWGFVVRLDDALERKGPAVLLCFSGSGSLMPLFLFCRDVKSTSTEQRCSAARGWIFICNQGSGLRGIPRYNWMHPFFFPVRESDTFNLELDLAMGKSVCVSFPLFTQIRCSILTSLTHSSVKYGCLSGRKWLMSGSI